MNDRSRPPACERVRINDASIDPGRLKLPITDALTMTSDPEKRKNSPIRPEMTVLDVVSRHRGTESVFHRYDEQAGECICCRALFDSLEDVAKRYGLDLERFLRDLAVAAREEDGQE